MSDDIRKVDSIQPNEVKGDSRETGKRNNKAERAFSAKMAQIGRVETVERNALTEKNNKLHTSSIFEQLANTKANQEQFHKTYLHEVQDENIIRPLHQSGPAEVQAKPEMADYEETGVMDRLVDSVKVSVRRTDSTKEVSLDVSAYLPGTTFTISKQKDGFKLNFETKVTNSADVLRKQQSNLLSRLQVEVDPQLRFDIEIKPVQSIS
jgi:hypothetical protein